jgi:hypothetical protein
MGSEFPPDGDPDKACGDIEVLERPAQENLRGLRSEIYSAGPTRRRVVSASSMASSSISRSSLSHSRPISEHRHKSELVHRSHTEVKRHKRRKSISKDDDDSSHYISVPRRSKARTSTIKIIERGRDDDSSDTGEDGAMSVVSDESGSEAKPKPNERKPKVTYVKPEQPRSSRRNSLRDVADDEKTSKDKVKASTKSLHRSNTTSSHRVVQRKTYESQNLS